MHLKALFHMPFSSEFPLENFFFRQDAITPSLLPAPIPSKEFLLFVVKGVFPLPRHSLLEGNLVALKRLFLYTLSGIFCELCCIGKVYILFETKMATILFCFTNLKAFFVQATLNLCNKMARCWILRRKDLCLNQVTKVRVECLMFNRNEVLQKNFCSNLSCQCTLLFQYFLVLYKCCRRWNSIEISLHERCFFWSVFEYLSYSAWGKVSSK